MTFEQIIQLIFVAIFIGVSLVAKAIEAAKKKERQQQRRPGPGPRQAESDSSRTQGKSLAEWIEEVKRNAEQSAPAPAKKEPVHVEDLEDAEFEDLEPHHVPRAEYQPQHETTHVPQESKHIFQEAIHSRTAPEEDEESERKGRRHGHHREKPQTSRIAPRYEGEYAEELVERESIKGRAPRAKRARRAGSRNQSARTAVGMIDISGDALRKAFILKELLEEPICLRGPSTRRP